MPLVHTASCASMQPMQVTSWLQLPPSPMVVTPASEGGVNCEQSRSELMASSKVMKQGPLVFSGGQVEYWVMASRSGGMMPANAPSSECSSKVATPLQVVTV